MGGAPLLLAIAVVTVDAGWESDGRDGYRYIIQIPAEQLREVERTGQITSQLPEDLRGRVSSVVVQVGSDPLPRPDVPPRAEIPASEAPTSDASEVADAGPPKTYLPSPDETVRAQGDANGFGLPAMNSSASAPSPADSSGGENSSAEIGRLAATDRGSRVETPPPGRGDAANSYGTSQFSGFGFETQSRSNSAAPSTSGSSPGNVPSTSRSSTSGAAASPPATGFAAADGSRDNRWFPGPQSPSTADSPNSATAGSPTGTTQSPAPSNSASATPPASNPPASNPPASNPPASNPPASNPPATRQGDSAPGASGNASEWSLPRDERNSASHPPSLSGAGNSPNPGASTAGTRSDQSTYDNGLNTTEARQSAADRQLLEEVGIDASGHAYDKRTNQPLYENDPRYPLIVDYVRRMDQAEKERERQRAAALPSRSLYDDRVSSGPADRVPPAAGDNRSAWGYDPNGYDARGGMNGYPNGYGPAPAYNQNPNYAAYGPQPAAQPPAATPPAGNWQTDPRLAQNPPAAATMTPVTVSQPAIPEARQPRDESPSDAEESSRGSKSRDASVKTQPLFMFLLLLSIVGNIYLGIAISRLIRRYRNLVSTHRGTAITA